MIGNVTDIQSAVKWLSQYDDAILKLVLSKTALDAEQQKNAIASIKFVKTQHLITEASKEQIITDGVALGLDRQKLENALENTFAANTEAGSVKACTAAELEHGLVVGGMTPEKAKEIAARYANAAAANKEGQSIANVSNMAKLSWGKIIGFFKSTAGIITLAGAALYAVFRIYQNHIDNIRKAAEEAKETLSNLTSEVSNLETELENIKKRIAEINALDAPTLADMDELAKLKEQNDELERKLRIQKELASQKAAEAEDAAHKYLDTYTFVSGGERLDVDQWVLSAVKSQQLLRESMKVEEEELDKLLAGGADSSSDEVKSAQKKLSDLQFMYEAQGKKLAETVAQVNDNVIASFGDSPVTDWAKQFAADWEKALAAYDFLLNGLDFSKVKDLFDESYRKDLLPYLDSSRFGGNVDLTIRPRIDASEMEKAGWDMDSGDYATIFSNTFANEDGTVSILATPILPDGTVLSPAELQTYVEEILAGVHPDEKGVTLGVFNGEDALQQADEVAEKMHLAQEAWDEFVNELQEGGYISEQTADVLRVIANTVLKVGGNAVSAGDDIQTALASVTGELETAVAQYQLLKTAQSEYSESGRLSLATLNSLVEKFPQMAEGVALYIAGLKAGKDLLGDLSAAYETDKQNYYSSLIEKLGKTETFYNKLTGKQKTLIDDLGKSYGVDLQNFTTIEQKKLAVQAKIIAGLAANYSKYANASLEDLKKQHSLLSEELETIKSTDADPTIRMLKDRLIHSRSNEVDALADTIAAIEESVEAFNNIVKDGLVNSWDPSSYSDKASSSAKEIKDAFEELQKQLENWFGDMEFKVSLRVDAGDVEGAAKLYEEMIQQANKALDTAYASGKTVDDDWVQDLISRVNDYKKALSDLRLEEYDKLIAYNDDFDVWNKVSYSKLDVLADKLKKINELYLSGYLSYRDWYDYYTDTAKDAYDIQKDALEELLETTMDAIKEQNDAQVEALEKQSDAYQKIIDQKKKLLEDTRDQSDYEREVAKRVKEIAKLQERITQLELDDSREAAAERHKLEEELAEKQEALADYQAEHGTDAAIEALDQQGEAFENSMQDRINAVKAEVENEAELRRRAIALIDGSYQQMINNVRGYFESLGVVIDDELLGKLEQGLSLVGQFGSYNGASSGIGSSSLLPQQQIPDYVEQMKRNSQSWHTANAAGDQAETKRLSQENERIAQMLKTIFGLDIWKNAAQGKWYIRLNGQEMALFDAYHQGGVVSGYPTRNNKEVMALLERGEVVMDDGKQGNFLAMIKHASQVVRDQIAYNFSQAASLLPKAFTESAGTLGGFSPTFQFTFNHSGPMTEADAKHYGQVAADAALDKLWTTLQKRGIT